VKSRLPHKPSRGRGEDFLTIDEPDGRGGALALVPVAQRIGRRLQWKRGVDALAALQQVEFSVQLSFVRT
jgi:hypothetical protein